MTALIATVAAGRQPDRDAVAAFLYREAALLDEQRFDEWLALFDERGDYWVPATWNQPDPFDHLSIFYEDRNLLQVRINRLRHPGTATMHPAPRTLHQITNIRVAPAGDAPDAVAVESALVVVEYRMGEQRIFAGRCRHDLRGAGDRWRIQRKRIDLLNCDRDGGHLRINLPL